MVQKALQLPHVQVLTEVAKRAQLYAMIYSA
jgi:hypothetical protein